MSAPAARWTRVYLALYIGYVALGMLMRWNGWLHVDHIWFVDAARHILDGSWRIYEFRPALSAGIAPPDGLAYSYSPLTALLMAPFVALADALGQAGFGASVGGADGMAYRLIALPLLVADALAMNQLRRLVRAWRPQVDETPLFLGHPAHLVLHGLPPSLGLPRSPGGAGAALPAPDPALHPATAAAGRGVRRAGAGGQADIGP